MPAKPATSNYQDVAKKWNTYASQFSAAGVPQTAWQPVMKQDISNVVQKNTYEMSSDEISSAVIANMTGQNPIKESPRHSSGFLGDIGTIASNIEPDVSNFIYDAPRGVADLAKQLVAPSTYKLLGDALTENPGDPSSLTPNVQALYKKAGVTPSGDQSFTTDMKLLAATPLIQDLPGITDVAGATTSAGRQSLMEHPVTSLLDVLPLTKGLTEAGGIALGGEEAAETSPLSALAEGHPVKAGLRAVDQSLGSKALSRTDFGAEAAEKGLGPGQAALSRLGDATGLSSEKRGYSAAISRSKRITEAEGSKYALNVKKAAGKLSHAEQEQMVLADQSGDLSGLSPEQMAALTRLRGISQQQEDDAKVELDNKGRNRMEEWTGEFGERWFKPRESPIVKAKLRASNLQSLAEKRSAVVEDARDRLENANSDVYTTRSKLPRYGENRENNPDPVTLSNPTTAEGLTSDPTIEGTVRTPQDIAKAIAPLTDMFSKVDPNSLTGGAADGADDLVRGLSHLSSLPAGVKKPLISSAMAMAGDITDHSGLAARLAQALGDGDIQAARSTLAAMDRAMSKDTRFKWDDVPELNQIHNYVKQLREELTGFSRKTQRDGVKAREAARAAKAFRRANEKHVATQARLAKATDDFRRERYKSPQENLHPLIRKTIREKVAAEVSKGDGGGSIDPDSKLAQLDILDNYDKLQPLLKTGVAKDYEAMVGKDEFAKIQEDAITEAFKLAGQGLEPVYFHQIGNAQLDRVVTMRVISDVDRTPKQFMNSAFNMQDSSLNIVAGLTQSALNVIGRDGMREIDANLVQPSLVKQGDMFGDYVDRAQRLEAKGRGRRYASTQAHAVHLMNQEWKPYDFNGHGMKSDITTVDPEQMMIPKALSDTLSSFQNQGKFLDGSGGLGTGYNAAMKIFRTSVLYGPRHFAHVVIGGLMPVVLSEPLALAKGLQAFRSMEGDGLLGKIMEGGTFKPEEESGISKFLSQPSNYRPDDQVNFRIGHSYAELFKRVTGPVHNMSEAMGRIESMTQNLYRGMVYLNSTAKGADPMAALEAARRISLDMDDFAPMERTILKQVMPFYSFTRFAAKYLYQLPFDHPLRVAIITQSSLQAQEEWKSGLPQKMMSLFFLGSPDKNGNITTIDTKNANPFRSIANEFTMQGFISSLNPAVQGLFSAAGMDPQTGTGQLYPELAYNANTGDLTAKRPANSLLNAAEAFVPEIGGIDNLVSHSKELRNLRATDQGSYMKQIYNDFNIPFAPGVVYNVNQEYQDTAENAYTAAKSAASSAVSHNNFTGDVSRYDLVPSSITGTTELYTPEQLQQVTEQMYNGVPAGVDPLAFQLTNYH